MADPAAAAEQVASYEEHGFLVVGTREALRVARGDTVGSGGATT